jgi:ankyrin repeat protein
MSAVTDLHAAVKQGDLEPLRRLLEHNPGLANARSETDTRGTYPLHVAAEFGQAAAAALLLAHGADVSHLDLENDATALSWAAFFGRPEATRVLLQAGSDAKHRNRHGLTALDCALGGARGQWQRFSNASLEDWQRCAELLQQR